MPEIIGRILRAAERCPEEPSPTYSDAAGRTGRLLSCIRGQIWGGICVIASFFCLLGGWAAFAEIAGATIASGAVGPDGSRRSVQHLEGGIIRELNVRDGSAVKAGDKLLELEDIQARASFDLLSSRYATLLATETRLLAEQLHHDGVTFPQWLLDRAKVSEPAAAAVASQRELFAANRREQSESVAILRQRVAQLGEEINGLTAQVTSYMEQLRLIKMEMDDVTILYNKGLERRPRLLALQRGAAQLDGNRAEREAQIARARQTIAETELQIVNSSTIRMQESSKQLAQVQSDLAEVQGKLTAAKDVLTRTIVIAPIDGTVINSHFHTVGGVIQAGEVILEIVPQHEPLVIEARIQPADIDVVRPGLRAEILLSAFKQRITPRIYGSVTDVAPDSLVDESTKMAYYKVRIVVPEMELDRVAKDLELVPGMSVEVFINTGVHTVLDYILQPIYDSMHRTFRET